jgi:hypothetical protein
MKLFNLTLIIISMSVLGCQAQSVQLSQQDGFPLVYGSAADIIVDKGDHQVVQIAADLFAQDVRRVTSKEPHVKHQINKTSKNIVVIGTIGKSALIQQLIANKQIDVTKIQGKWETALITTVSKPFEGVDKALVIAGSDRRGAAYGVFEISEKMGVSPWYWWADAAVRKKESVFINRNNYQHGPPSVKYRGIFINDEMWGLRPWAEKRFAPKEGKGIGPTTHKKIFELLLRLKANHLWPAMHRGTKPFNYYPENKKVADDYAIVMGSSHIEPMLRNNIGGAEWDTEGKGPWSYIKNKANIYKYWEDRIKTNGPYENVYTIGMRGQDDEALKDGSTIKEKIKLLEDVFRDQRGILHRQIKKDVTKIPQVFIPYTEVLGFYNQGMKVPDDVIICWPDDNFGYIRRLPNSKEQKRPGGSGVYYHIQWLNGATSAYTWLNTTPLALIHEEMMKAYEHKVNKLWVVNVGDIKPGEIGTEFFLDMAWDAEHWKGRDTREFLIKMAQRDFGSEHADVIADILTKHFELGYTRRPEHMIQGNPPRRPLKYSWFHHDTHGDEAGLRLKEYHRISTRAQKIYEQIPKAQKDSFFQLVLYPVRCADLMNQKAIFADKNKQHHDERRASVRKYHDKALSAEKEIARLTEHYNNTLIGVGDKWKGIISKAPGPWGGQRFQFLMPPLSDFAGLGPATLAVSLEKGIIDQALDFSVFTKDSRFVDLYNKGQDSLSWKAVVSAPWIKCQPLSGQFKDESRVLVNIDWTKAPHGNDSKADIVFSSGKQSIRIPVHFFNPKYSKQSIKGFVESHGYISMEAEHFSKSLKGRKGGKWKTVKNLGRSGDGVTVFPKTLPRYEGYLTHAPTLSYDFHSFSEGEMTIDLYFLPIKPINPSYRSETAVSIDGAKPVKPSLVQQSVLDNLALYRCKYSLKNKGPHTLKIMMIDPQIVIDKIVIVTNDKNPASYQGPRESPRFK